MNKELLEQYLKEGKSTRKIAELMGVHHNTVSYWIKKYNLNDKSKFKKTDNYKFGKIDSKEKAYLLGFILADSHISDNNSVEISVSMQDKEVVEYLSRILNSNVSYDNIMDKKAKRFPRARTVKKIEDITKFIGGRRKEERHFPIVNKKYAKYLLQGLFDADGCITWGVRKDKKRLWHKICITSQLNILIGVQNFLNKTLGISTVVRPKGSEKCYIIEFANKEDVIKFLNYIYSDDYIVLKRKYFKSNALRLELGEFGES